MQLTKWVHEPICISKSTSFIDLVQGHSDLTFSNFFSLETAKQIEAKFHVEPLWERGMKVNINGLCHMTKMAAMSTYGKNLLKSSSLEPKGRWPWNLLCGIGYSSSDPGLTLTYFTARSKLVPFVFLYGKMLKL